MAKGSIFDRADALRRGSRGSATGGSEESAPSEAVSEAPRRTKVRTRRAKASEPEAAAPQQAPTRQVVRRRSAKQEEPEPVATAAVAKEEVPVVDAEEVPSAETDAAPAPAPKKEAKEAESEPEAVAPEAEPEAAPETAPEAAPEAGPVSVDSLLSEGATSKKRVHKVLSDGEVEADAETRKKRSVKKVASAEEAPKEAAKAESEEESASAEAEATASPAADADTKVEVKTSDEQSLESLLKEQGIVQHKPKKGRRIIEDSMTATTAAAVSKPPATAGNREKGGAGEGRPAPSRSGVSLFAKEKAKRGPVRFINQNESEDARNRKRRGKGKKVVQRHDVLYGVERRRGRGKGRGGAARGGLSTTLTTPAAHKRIVKVHGSISVAELANAMGVKGGVVMKVLIGMGTMVTLNELVDFETAQVVAQEFDYEAEDVSFKEEEVLFGATATDEAVVEEEGESRAPVVTIMGHVDHGKTTLLDAIRSTDVADGEAGGITQHISAFDVEAAGQQITFVDTPGHAAFTAMRARGAQITDIVVLVVAVTEGVMPQTVEVISHAKAAEVPIIVALNKIDMPEANADRCRQQLSEHELIPEDWGGDIQMVEISAKEGTGIDMLLESISLQAEIMELKAPADCTAQGRVVEAQIEKGRGPVAVAIVQKGTLNRGDVVVAGTTYGKVRAILETGGSNAKLKSAGPSSPVCILGLAGLPSAGDEFVVVKSEKDAKLVTEHRRNAERAQSAADTKPRVSLDDVFERLKEGENKELNLIVKADVQGSVEAMKQVLAEIEVRDVKIRILHSAVGGVTEGDVTLASASEAVIVGFCVRPDTKARNLAEKEGVDIRTYRVIYKAVDEIKQALVGLLDPEFVEKVMGHAEVREVFKVSKVGAIAGSFIQDGKVNRNQQARLLRNSVVIWEGKVGSLRRFKDDVREVLQGYECGIGLDGYDDVKVDDIIETFITEEVRPSI